MTFKASQSIYTNLIASLALTLGTFINIYKLSYFQGNSQLIDFTSSFKFCSDFKITYIKILKDSNFYLKIERKIVKMALTFTCSAIFLYFITSRTLTFVGAWSVNALAHTKVIIFNLEVKFSYASIIYVD